MNFKKILVEHQDINSVIKLFNSAKVSYVAGKHNDETEVVSFASTTDFETGIELLAHHDIWFEQE